MSPQASLSKATAPTTLRPWLPDTSPETDRLFPLKRTGPSIHDATPHHAADAWHDEFSAGNQIRFGPFVLDAANSRLSRDGSEIRVRSQVFELIKVLASQLNREVSFAQLMAGVWKGTMWFYTGWPSDWPADQWRAVHRIHRAGARTRLRTSYEMAYPICAYYFYVADLLAHDPLTVLARERKHGEYRLRFDTAQPSRGCRFS